MKTRFAHLVLILICTRLSVGCGSIIHGVTEKINISSNPQSAEVWIDGMRIGTTPAEVTLKRSQDHFVTLKKDGYREITVMIESSISEWTVANFWLFSWVGCLVDYAWGGAYKLEPERMDIDMGKVAALGGEAIIHINQTELDSVRQLHVLGGFGDPETVVDIRWDE